MEKLYGLLVLVLGMSLTVFAFQQKVESQPRFQEHFISGACSSSLSTRQMLAFMIYCKLMETPAGPNPKYAYQLADKFLKEK